MSDWQAAGIRFTAFPSPEAKIDPSHWWSNLLGYPPESVSERPKAGQHQEEGVFRDEKLTLAVQPQRIDWALSPPVSAEAEATSPAVTFGEYPDVAGPFVELMMRWLQMCPPVTRVGFGAALLQEIPDKRTGYEKMQRYLPDIRLDLDSSDFFYQINRQRSSKSGVRDLMINRLTKWAVVNLGSVTVTIGPRDTSVGVTDRVYACRLEIDVNTALEFKGELPSASLPSILSELSDLASELAEQGDIK